LICCQLQGAGFFISWSLNSYVYHRS
jgi:hypothetical protein